MGDTPDWFDLGAVEELATRELQSGVCNHAGGPLGEGTIDRSGYVTCLMIHGTTREHALVRGGRKGGPPRDAAGADVTSSQAAHLG